MTSILPPKITQPSRMEMSTVTPLTKPARLSPATLFPPHGSWRGSDRVRYHPNVTCGNWTSRENEGRKGFQSGSKTMQVLAFHQDHLRSVWIRDWLWCVFFSDRTKKTERYTSGNKRVVDWCFGWPCKWRNVSSRSLFNNFEPHTQTIAISAMSQPQPQHPTPV